MTCDTLSEILVSDTFQKDDRVIRTLGNGRGGLILKRHLSSGQRLGQFVRIAPGLGTKFS